MFKYLKCLIAAILIISSLLSCVLCTSAASANALCVKVDTVSAKTGDTVKVNVTVTNNPGVTAVKLVVNFDEDVLTLVGAEDTGLFKEGIFSDDYSSDYELTWFDALSTTDNTATGVIATLSFKVNKTAKAGTSAVSVKVIGANDILDADLNKITLDATAGAVNVKNGTVTIGDVNDDGVVTADDAIYVLCYTLYGVQQYPLNQDCDFTQDKSVTSDDAIYLLYNVVFGDEKYPLETDSVSRDDEGFDDTVVII